MCCYETPTTAQGNNIITPRDWEQVDERMGTVLNRPAHFRTHKKCDNYKTTRLSPNPAKSKEKPWTA